ncbi:amino acid adenylation domain-containing protein [Streptomyces sp. 891-h]|uniref:amino acid adenylation domain-containing protein n=1 Tax=Streptomyces sp. 891-h TaxID=2720714 RepID=UPI001FA9A9BA|nr:amino acid adenylation domain-containing protein [Streptomyces sp. 891-h]UNZ16008.1 amino acid adenylation domain-containing protein [Streptomyces sp. 891-h]
MTSVQSGTPTRTTRAPSPPLPEGAPATTDDAVVLVTDRPRTREAARGPWGAVRLAGAEGPAALAALLLVLHRWTGQGRLRVDTDLADGGAGTLTVDVAGHEPVAALATRVARTTPTQRGPHSATAVLFADRAPAEESRGQEPDAGPYELSLTRDGTGLLLGYRASLFVRETAERLGRHLTRALRCLTEQPHTAVREVGLLDDGERELVLRTFNDTARPYPSSTTVHELFREQARRTPAAPAVTWRDRTMSYAELDAHTDRLAAALRAAGARRGDRIGLHTSRTPDLLVGALGILKAGCAYLPLDTEYPAERTEWLLADSAVVLLVASTDRPPRFAFAGTVLDPWYDTGTDADTDDDPQVSAQDLAYICYTSGTTGRPKGVEVTHRNVVRLVRGTAYVRFGPDMSVMPTGSIAFDASTFELWGPLLNGGRVHLTGSDTVLDAGSLGRELAARRITTLWLTSPLFNQLVEQDATAFRPLRELVVGGDALSAAHLTRVMAACPELTLVNGYGPTENTTFSVTHRLTRADLERIPIGRPIANSTAYVLDEAGQPCPVGVPGELHLGGDGVARGYLGRPALTAERFIKDPFTPRGDRLYRSGDLARWRSDGVLEFLGRRDHQVKVRGFRVEPAEVESVMADHPGVAEAVVTARSRPGRSETYLCGYYTGKAGQHPPTPEELRSLLARTLPGHMVPSYLVPLPQLPLNRNGKVERALLPDPDGSHLLAATAYVPPADETERVLVELAEAALGISGIGAAHDLRDLGADSLTATLLAAGARRRLGRACPVSAVLRCGTPARLAALLRDSSPVERGTQIPPAPRRETYPLTPQQRQLYFEQLKDERAVHYNVPVTLALPADTDPLRLATALRQLAARHDALRTRFVTEGGGIRQRVEPAVDVPVRVAEGPPGPLREFVRPFDLGRAPLWRAEIHRTATEVTLRLDLHHIVVDGFSLAPLFADLAALYGGEEPPPPGVQYRDYAEWLAGPAGEALRTAQRAYWQRVFATPPDPADLPTDHPRPDLRSLDGDVVTFDLGQVRTRRLRGLAHDHGVTLFAVLASAYSLLLAGLKGTGDVTVGVPVSGRTAPGLEATVGMCAGTVCLRSAPEPRVPFGAFLRSTAQAAEDAFAHQDFPFEDLVSLAAPVRDYSRTPVFEALIALHSGRYLSVDFQGARVPLRLEQTGQAVFDLNMQIYEDTGTLRVAWQYATRLLRRETVEGWRESFTALLDAIVADPSAPLGSLLPALDAAPSRPAQPAPAASAPGPAAVSGSDTHSDFAPDFDFDL